MLLLSAAVAAPFGAAVAEAPSASAAPGAPFVVHAVAATSGDYATACDQFSNGLLLRIVRPPRASPEAARAACVALLPGDVADRGAGWVAAIASTRVVEVVPIDDSHASVTVQTTLFGLQPLATGRAVLEDGRWKIDALPSGAHVGRSLVQRITNESMLPGLAMGDAVLVDQDAYRRAKPRIGDIVVFRPPIGAQSAVECGRRPPKGQACAIARSRDSQVWFLKRIVARPGDRISIRRGRVIRNGVRVTERFVKPCGAASGEGCDFPRTLTVPPRRYYVLGDNRAASDDSRFWGPVAARAIVGRVTRVGP